MHDQTERLIPSPLIHLAKGGSRIKERFISTQAKYDIINYEVLPEQSGLHNQLDRLRSFPLKRILVALHAMSTPSISKL